MVILTATEAGFHTLSPLATPMSPNVFVNADLNPHGVITGNADDGWQTTDSLSRADYGIYLTEAAFSQTGVVTGALLVSEVTYTRMEGDLEVEIGTLTLDPPISLEMSALRDDEGATVGWTGDLGTALAEAVQHQGLAFNGGSGVDMFDPASQILPIYASVEINGRGGDDVLAGGRADDTIRGGEGNDLITDEGGHNLLRGGSGDDTVQLGTFSDASVAKGGAGDDLLTSSNGSDFLFGNAGNDWLEGGRGNDLLRGGSGDDTLNGGEGHDRLFGGEGDDTLTGGLGADSFVFRAGQTGHDTITDFDLLQGDSITLRGVDLETVTVTTQGEDLILIWDDAQSSVTLEGWAGQEDMLLF